MALIKSLERTFARSLNRPHSGYYKNHSEEAAALMESLATSDRYP